MRLPYLYLILLVKAIIFPHYLFANDSLRYLLQQVSGVETLVYLFFFLFIVTIVVYVSLKLKTLKKKNQELTDHVRSYTEDLRDTLQRLTASEYKHHRHTHIQGRLITAITHDIKNPLKYNTIVAGQMVRDLEKENNSPGTMNAKLVYDASYRLQILTENLLQYISLYSREGNITQEIVNLYDVVEDKIAMFQPIAINQSTVLMNDVSHQTYINSHSKLLGIIIHNLLDNAIKVAGRGGKVSISSFVTDQQTAILITNTGPEMSAALLEWCNLPVTEHDPTPVKLKEHKGFGLLIVKELMALINGKLEATSGQSGTSIKLIFR